MTEPSQRVEATSLPSTVANNNNVIQLFNNKVHHKKKKKKLNTLALSFIS